MVTLIMSHFTGVHLRFSALAATASAADLLHGDPAGSRPRLAGAWPGCGFKAFEAERLLAMPRVFPYDAFALWMHHAHGRIALSQEVRHAR
jgi:hypothetical protein